VGYAVTVEAGAAGPGPVSPGYLETSYGLYRSLCEKPFDAVVFDFPGGHAYCTAVARRLGLAFQETPVVVRCVGSALRPGERGDDGGLFLSKNRAGVAVTERLAVEHADAIVCDREAMAALEANGWSLPVRRFVLERDDDRDRAFASIWAAALDCGTRPAERAETIGLAPVSVVVARYERTEYLPLCLDALARQDHPVQEVVVVDDGSTTPAAAAQLERLERDLWPFALRVLRLPHAGVSAARNAGWRAAEADLVVFVDDDDIPYDDLVGTLVRARSVSGSDVVVSGARYFRADASPIPHDDDVIKLYLGRPYEVGLLSNQYGGPVALWSRQLLDRIGGFANVTVLEDWEILARATRTGARVAALPEPRYWYRLTRDSLFSSGKFRTVERNEGLEAVARVYADALPDGLRLVPRLALGAYEELEHRRRAAEPRRRALAVRTRALVRHARRMRADQGALAALRAGLRFVGRRLR
jgi:glycosyltransferase involved in cell wall biosynthesis